MATKKSTKAKATNKAVSEDAGAFSEWMSNPAIKSLATGLATTVLTKLATSLAGKYPQISQLLHEGLESIEGKLAEFNGAGSAQASTTNNTRTKKSASAVLN